VRAQDPCYCVQYIPGVPGLQLFLLLEGVYFEGWRKHAGPHRLSVLTDSLIAAIGAVLGVLTSYDALN
jgi:hypothetical protein